MQPRYKQHQTLMQQAMLQQQQQLYHSGVLAAAAISQMEPIPSGNLPPGFDSSSCRSVYVGNIHPNVTESLLSEVFQSIGPLEGCKLIRKEKIKPQIPPNLEDQRHNTCIVVWGELNVSFCSKTYQSSFGFVDYHDRRSATYAIVSLHGRQLYGQAIKVNWAYASGQREDTSGHFNIFVGDLSPEVTDASIYACFSVYASCSDARVMWDNKTGRSRGFGFVSFRNQQDAQSAINDLNEYLHRGIGRVERQFLKQNISGKWLGSRQIRCNWAAKGANEDKQTSDNQNAVVLTNGSLDNADSTQDKSSDAPENNPAYTTVYVGNLAHEVTQAELHRQFHNLGAGVIEEVRIQREKGFGFVRYHAHNEAALAIQLGNGRIVGGKSMKCSWGTKPTPPGTISNPLPPPGPPFQLLSLPGLNHQGYSHAELMAYQRQLVLSQAVAAGSLAAQQAMVAHPSASLGSTGSQGMYDGYPMNSSTQELMYYH